MTDLTIRRPDMSESNAIAALFLASKRHALPYLPEVHSDEETYAWMRHVNLGTREVWIAEQNGAIVGFMALHEGWLEHLYLHPDNLRQGIGSALLAKAKARRPSGLKLWAFQKNTPARRFYEKHGFIAAEVTDGANNEEGEPDVRYVWRP